MMQAGTQATHQAEPSLTPCREYSIGLRCEIERKDPEKDYMNKNPKRAAELAAYFTHAKLQVLPHCPA